MSEDCELFCDKLSKKLEGKIVMCSLKMVSV